MRFLICLLLLGIFGQHGWTQPNQQSSAPTQPVVKIYPNPSQQGEPININMEGVKEEKVLVTLYNVYGKMVFSRVILQENSNVPTAIDPRNRIPPGVYLVKGSSNDQLFEKKLVIRE